MSDTERTLWAMGLCHSGILSEWQITQAALLVSSRLTRSIVHSRVENTFTCTGVVNAKHRELLLHQSKVTFTYVEPVLTVAKFVCSCEM
jgi:hypothetical protein